MLKHNCFPDPLEPRGWISSSLSFRNHFYIGVIAAKAPRCFLPPESLAFRWVSGWRQINILNAADPLCLCYMYCPPKSHISEYSPWAAKSTSTTFKNVQALNQVCCSREWKKGRQRIDLGRISFKTKFLKLTMILTWPPAPALQKQRSGLERSSLYACYAFCLGHLSGEQCVAYR